MNPLSPSLRTLAICSLAATVIGCARASREPDQAPAAASGERSEQQQEIAEFSPSPAVPALSAVPPEVEAVQQQPALGPVPSKPTRYESARGAASPAREAVADDRKMSRASRAPGAMHAPAGEPTLAYSESPELVAAIVEFDKQWDALSVSRACDEACRAFDSMRRSAKRICDLVVAGDPRQRCRTAQARLDQASRDLAARCTECR
jgi:hypothetical protein